MRRELALLDEMIDAADHAITLVNGLDADALAHDRLRRDALLWNFTVLGEAAAQMPSAFKLQHPTTNWTRPTQLRNRIVHGYWSIDLEILVTTAELDLPPFVANLRTLRTTQETAKS